MVSTTPICFYCGVHVYKFSIKRGQKNPDNMLTRDHLTPRIRGGSMTMKVICCHKCNQDKGELTLEEYRAVLEFRTRGFNLSYRFPGEL